MPYQVVHARFTCTCTVSCFYSANLCYILMISNTYMYVCIKNPFCCFFEHIASALAPLQHVQLSARTSSSFLECLRPECIFTLWNVLRLPAPTSGFHVYDIKLRILLSTILDLTALLMILDLTALLYDIRPHCPPLRY